MSRRWSQSRRERPISAYLDLLLGVGQWPKWRMGRRPHRRKRWSAMGRVEPFAGNATVGRSCQIPKRCLPRAAAGYQKNIRRSQRFRRPPHPPGGFALRNAARVAAAGSARMPNAPGSSTWAALGGDAAGGVNGGQRFLPHLSARATRGRFSTTRIQPPASATAKVKFPRFRFR
jgi:hypothetical protein